MQEQNSQKQQHTLSTRDMRFLTSHYPAIHLVPFLLIASTVSGEQATAEDYHDASTDITLVASVDGVTTDQIHRDLKLKCDSVAAYHPNYSLPWDQGTCELIVTCNSPSFDTELDCCKGAYGGQISMACLGKLDNPPTLNPTKVGGSDIIYYPDYSLAWPEGKCINTTPVPSGWPTYSTMLACCKAAYDGQMSGTCIKALPNPPTGAPTKIGEEGDYYPDYTLAWPAGKCINTAPVPSGWPTYTTMLACCKAAYGGQMSGACIKALPNPPTSAPTNVGEGDYYPDYNRAWPEGKCINALPVPSGWPTYKTQLGCCQAEYIGQVSKACLIAAITVTISPTTTPQPFVASMPATPTKTPKRSNLSILSIQPITSPSSNSPTTSNPSIVPTTEAPSKAPRRITGNPSIVAPTTVAPSNVPTTANPSDAPTTANPSIPPTMAAPSTTPTTASPSVAATTAAPSTTPTTASPSIAPTTAAPSTTPTTANPSVAATTAAPSTTATTASLSVEPTTATPSTTPTTASPSVAPTTAAPSTTPTTSNPSGAATTTFPSATPTTAGPSVAATTAAPSTTPTTAGPSIAPTTAALSTTPPTANPSIAPTTAAPSTVSPTLSPTSAAPSVSPTDIPSQSPTGVPTNSPTGNPTFVPTHNCVGATLETWTGITGAAVANLISSTNNFTNPPNESVRLVSVLEGPSDIGDYYGCRMKGWLVPPTNGSYTFYIKSDDTSQFWFSTTSGENYNLALIAYLNGHSFRSFTRTPTQKSASKSLVAGQAYYYEAYMKEDSGGDYFALGWKKPGETAINVIPASNSRVENPFAPGATC